MPSARYSASPEALFSWLDAQGVRYAVLRGLEGLRAGAAASEDVDLLVDDDAIPEVRARCRRRRAALKVDLYGVAGKHGSDYHGFPHLPQALGGRILERRRRVEERLYAPRAEDELDALLYHLAYHKNEQSGIHWADPARSADSPHLPTLTRLLAETGLELEPTHRAFHEHLVRRDLGVTPERLVRYIQHDFRHGRKVVFHALLRNELPGELNLFVVRGVAVRERREDELLGWLRERFEILALKPVPWWTRVRAGRRMRGGKWRRGGLPRIAAVVFDPAPVATTAEDRAVHPLVFNRNQFAKLSWRERFVERSRARASANPIHSTDNEAEAIGHLPLFFTDEEQARILASATERRAELRP